MELPYVEFGMQIYIYATGATSIGAGKAPGG